jgi:hypothetical protein
MVWYTSVKNGLKYAASYDARDWFYESPFRSKLKKKFQTRKIRTKFHKKQQTKIYVTNVDIFIGFTGTCVKTIKSDISTLILDPFLILSVNYGRKWFIKLTPARTSAPRRPSSPSENNSEPIVQSSDQKWSEMIRNDQKWSEMIRNDQKWSVQCDRKCFGKVAKFFSKNHPMMLPTREISLLRIINLLR